MPRHNKQRLPRHRAPRRIHDSPRRVRVNAAISAAEAALAATGQDEAETVEQQPISPRPRRFSRSFRWRRPSSVRPPGAPDTGPRVMRGAARSLLVTPWFAAGTGFVIATGLWIYSPHTELRFPDSAPGVSVCSSRGCVTDSPKVGGGSLATGAPGQRITGSQPKTSKKTAKSDVVTNSKPTAGLKFKFIVLWRQGETFDAYITVSGHSVPTSWRLSFEIPGVQIDYVTGVSWQPMSSKDGGTASAPAWQPGTDTGNAGTGDGSDAAANANGVAAHDGPVISFSVSGTGSVGLPSTCSFDGSTCKFH
jgi:hypothetical protein